MTGVTLHVHVAYKEMQLHRVVSPDPPPPPQRETVIPARRETRVHYQEGDLDCYQEGVREAQVEMALHTPPLGLPPACHAEMVGKQVC